jgi:hypothetical protein
MKTPNMQTTAELNIERDFYRNRVIPTEKLRVMDRATEVLIASGLKASALKEGDYVEDFILGDAHDKPVRLKTLLEAGPVGTVCST